MLLILLSLLINCLHSKKSSNLIWFDLIVEVCNLHQCCRNFFEMHFDFTIFWVESLTYVKYILILWDSVIAVSVAGVFYHQNWEIMKQIYDTVTGWKLLWEVHQVELLSRLTHKTLKQLKWAPSTLVKWIQYYNERPSASQNAADIPLRLIVRDDPIDGTDDLRRGRALLWKPFWLDDRLTVVAPVLKSGNTLDEFTWESVIVNSKVI